MSPRDPACPVVTPARRPIAPVRRPFAQVCVRRQLRRRAQRLLAPVLALLCVLQPLTPVAAYRAQPAASGARGEVSSPRQQAARTSRVLASGAGSIPGIKAYTQSDVNCAQPQYTPVEPYHVQAGTGFGSTSKALYICSEGATVRVHLLAQGEGYGCNMAGTSLACVSGDCGAFVPLYPPKVAFYGTDCIFCNGVRSSYDADVFLPPGKYRMFAEAGSNGGCVAAYKIELSLTTPPVPGDYCRGKEDHCDCICPQAYDQDPVNTRTGNYTHSEVDSGIPTRGLPLEFERSYNSLDAEVGPLGRGWTHAYHMRLVTTTTGITFVAPRGSRLPFYDRGDGTYEPGPGVRATLVREGDGSYTLTRGDQVVRTFDAAGRLASLDDGRGNLTTLTYTGADLTAITAPDGRSLALAYDAGRIVQVADPLSHTVQYAYTGDNLTTVTDTLGLPWHYTYDAQGRMTGITDPDGHTVANEYDALGRVTVQHDKLSQASHFAYAADRTVLTDTNGVPITYTYDSLGMVSGVTDALGHTTSYEHDGNYNLLAVTDPLSRTTRYTWSACGCAITEIEDPLGHVTEREYDGHNNLLRETDPLTRTTRYAYDASDNLVAITNTLGYTATFAYDAHGQLVESVDLRGQRTRYGHDAYGNLSVITDTLDHATHMGYDLAGRLITLTDARQHATAFDYDAAGRPITTTNALDGETVYDYDALGRVTAVTDANGHTTRFQYDPAGRLITTTNALDGQTIYAYDPVGRVTSVADANGKVTRFDYDAVGRLITTTNALNGRTVYGYDAVGNLTRVTDPRGKTATFAYDPLDRTVAITDTLGHATWLGYDAVGNLKSSLDPTGVLVQYAYDDLDRLEAVTGPLGTVATYDYDPLGNLTAVADANGHALRYTYDPLSRLETVLDPLDGLTVYGYDPVGNLHTATDAREHTTTYDYDPLNRLQTVTDPLAHLTAYGHDRVGNTTVITDADQLVAHLAYDALDRLTAVQYADATVSYRYDAVGNRLAMTDTTGVTTYAYDSLYRPLTITAPLLPAGGGSGGGAVGYRYDPAGNRIQTLYPASGTVTYGYDDANRLQQVWDWEDRLTTYSYDHAGRVLGVQRPNGVDTDYDYDVAGRLVAIEHAKGEDWLTRFDYELDLEGNRVAVTETTRALGEYELPLLAREGTAGAEETGSALPVGEVIHYSYDQGDRLTGASYGNGDRYAYAYDLAGNRTALTVTTQGLLTETTGYSYDNADRLTSVDGMPIGYDNRGNQLGDGVWSYTYNSAGRMVRAETITATQVYTYSGDGLLVAQNLAGAETAFTWDLALALPQVLGTSNSMRALYGLERLAVVQGNEWHYPQHDAIGSVRQWTDAAGQVVGLQGYTPYGEPLVPLGPLLAPWGYTGEWQDPAGLVYLRARWYHGGLGRFTQVDPLRGLLTQPATRHAYGYALNAPLQYTDPSGELIEQILGGFLVGSGIAYGSQVIRNVRRHGLTTRAFTDIDWVGVAAGGVAGAVGAATFGVSGALKLGTGWGATLGTGAVSGVLSGQGARAFRNWATGRPLKEGLFDPRDMAVDAAAGAASAGLAKLWKTWREGRQVEPTGTCPGRPGRPGGPAHKLRVDLIKADIVRSGLLPKTEFYVRTPGGLKPARFVDVAALDPATFQPLEFHQVGSLKLSGFPVRRELQAILDILLYGDCDGVALWFHPT